MMSFDDIYRLLIESIFSSDTPTYLWMRPLDIVVHRLPEIMEHTALQREDRISTDHPSDRLGDVGDLFRVHEDILSVARTESELSYKWEDLVWYTDDSHLFDGLAAEVGDELIGVLLVFLYDLLYTGGLDTLIFDEVFERLLRDIPTEEVEAREKYSIWSVIDDQRYSCRFLEGDDVAPFFSDELAFQVVTFECHERLSRLTTDLSCVLLDTFYKYLFRDLYFTRFQVFLLLLDQREDIFLVAFFSILEEEVLRFFLGELRHVFELPFEFQRLFICSFELPFEGFFLLYERYALLVDLFEFLVEARLFLYETFLTFYDDLFAIFEVIS